MKKEINFDVKVLNGAIDVIGRYGGDKTKLSESQIKELEKVVEFTLDYVAETHVTSGSVVGKLVVEVGNKLALRSVRDPLTFNFILKTIVERGVLDNKEFALELSRNRSVSLSDYMSVEELLQRFPKFKEVEILETTTYEVIYTATGVLNHDEVKCDYISVEGNFVSVFKDNERVAIYNKDNFVRATLL